MSPIPPPHNTAKASDPGCRLSPEDRDLVTHLLGRASFTHYRIAVRCPLGGPAILENDPLDVSGRPFPTRYWMACRHLHAAVSRVEADGGVRALEDDPAMASAIRDAHERHASLHDGHHIGGVADPARVKCLHAQLAFALATGGNAVGDWILSRIDTPWPATCCAVQPERAP